MQNLFKNKYFLNTLKYSTAALLSIYFFNKIDFDLNEIVSRIKLHQIFGLFIIMFIIQLILIFRLNTVLRLNRIEILFKDIFRFHFIGIFFNTVLPGSISGELVKGFYLHKSQKEKVNKSIQSVFFDKVFGLYSLLILAVISILANYRISIGEIELFILSKSILFIFIVATIGLVIINNDKLYRKLSGYRLFRLSFVTQVIEQLRLFKGSPKKLIFNLALTVLAHTLLMYLFYFIVNELGYTTIPISIYFYICCIGVLVTALPISPAGIGMGQAAYYFLFENLAHTPGGVGVIAISIVQIITILLAIIGGVMYLMKKERINPSN